MRIIGGSLAGRKLFPPSNLPVRPTTDLAKEAIFNVLHFRFELNEVEVLDLFAGTGSIAFEFASRGAKSILAIDGHAFCLQFIKQQSDQFGIKSITTIKADVFKWLDRAPNKQFDFIFADPPYADPKITSLPAQVFNANLLKPDGWLILEHPAHISFSWNQHFIEHRKYGKTVFSIFGANPILNSDE